MVTRSQHREMAIPRFAQVATPLAGKISTPTEEIKANFIVHLKQQPAGPVQKTVQAAYLESSAS